MFAGVRKCSVILQCAVSHQTTPYTLVLPRLLRRRCYRPPRPLVRFRNSGRRRSLSRELLDVSVLQASRFQEGAEDGLWYSIYTATHCKTRNGREVPQADQARSKSGVLAVVGSGSMARCKARGTGRAEYLTRSLSRVFSGDRVAPGPRFSLSGNKEWVGDTPGDTVVGTVSPRSGRA